MAKAKYFARNDAEKKFDDEIRETLLKFGTKTEMALYLQNQMILNELRRLSIGNSKHHLV